MPLHFYVDGIFFAANTLATKHSRYFSVKKNGAYALA